MQLRHLAQYLDASLLCTDYGLDRYEKPGQRDGRLEDWGNPAYDAAVARLPARIEAHGVKVSKLNRGRRLVLGLRQRRARRVAAAAASRGADHDRQLIVSPAARYAALPAGHRTAAEIVRSVGWTVDQVPDAYAARSPSHHLAGLAAHIRSGMRFVDIWSLAPSEAHEFRGATCSVDANARWLGQLATVAGHPVAGYVTQLQHAHALWEHGRSVLRLAAIGRPKSRCRRVACCSSQARRCPRIAIASGSPGASRPTSGRP